MKDDIINAVEELKKMDKRRRQAWNKLSFAEKMWVIVNYPELLNFEEFENVMNKSSNPVSNETNSNIVPFGTIKGISVKIPDYTGV